MSVPGAAPTKGEAAQSRGVRAARPHFIRSRPHPPLPGEEHPPPRPPPVIWSYTDMSSPVSHRTLAPGGSGGAQGHPHRPVPRLTTTPRSLESFFMMMAARILRPSKEGWKLLVRALKHRWLSMAIWSWKVLPVRGSCGDRRPSQGPGESALTRQGTVLSPCRPRVPFHVLGG